MKIQVTPTGIPGIGALAWGTHVCQFYDGREDLADYLVPYFKTGLEHDEYCLWVTADPLSVEDARTLLRAAVLDLDTRRARTDRVRRLSELVSRRRPPGPRSRPRGLGGARATRAPARLRGGPGL